MTNGKNTKKGSGKKILAVAILGVVAGMLLAPKTGKELRRELKKIALKMEKEIIKQAEKTKEITQEKYEEIVEMIVDSYAKAKKISKNDVKAITKDLKKIWAGLSRKTKVKSK